MAGPTSFAPIIGEAIDIVERSGRQYHVLLIIADGQDSLLIITIGSSWFCYLGWLYGKST
ncbi:hypothetical protein MKW94_001568 [Papaver nudicaule]|uniref:Copine C-terminal domain-containing protein n=1 Tax=Papaver nudicaule TaxID=74823 RepID=A0AA41SCR4_PAPNU|nr:hypothetical protein [Papaver nudicaule]